MDDIEELYHLFPEIKQNINIEKKVGQGTFSFVYLGHFHKRPAERVALKYIIPTSSPNRTKQEIECLLNIGLVS
jgi:cell division control protein 7